MVPLELAWIMVKGLLRQCGCTHCGYLDGFTWEGVSSCFLPLFQALILQLPDWNGLSTEMRPVNPEALHKAIRTVKADLATALKPEMSELYKQLTLPTDQEDEVTEEATGRRKLRNTLLHFLSAMGDEEAVERAYKHFTEAKCMTDKYAGLIALSNMPVMQREKAFSRFYDDAAGSI